MRLRADFWRGGSLYALLRRVGVFLVRLKDDGAVLAFLPFGK
jgi:hypothetical protein